MEKICKQHLLLCEGKSETLKPSLCVHVDEAVMPCRFEHDDGQLAPKSQDFGAT